MQKLEEIDDDAAQEKINFVQILDQALANEYGLETIPALVYYRNKVPIVYQSMYIIIDSSFNFIHMIHPIQLILLLKDDLEDSEAVLQWLFKFRDTADAEDDEDGDNEAIIEEVNENALEQLIESTSFLAVLFCKSSFRLAIAIFTHLRPPRFV